MPVAHREITKKHIKRIAQEEAKKNRDSGFGGSSSCIVTFYKLEDGKITNNAYTIGYTSDILDARFEKYLNTHKRDYDTLTSIVVDSTIPIGTYIVVAVPDFVWFPYVYISYDEDYDEWTGDYSTDSRTVTEQSLPVLLPAGQYPKWTIEYGGYMGLGVVNRSAVEDGLGNLPGSMVVNIQDEMEGGTYYFENVRDLMYWKELDITKTDESEDDKDETE
jgi:hypothetical protein